MKKIPLTSDLPVTSTGGVSVGGGRLGRVTGRVRNPSPPVIHRLVTVSPWQHSRIKAEASGTKPRLDCQNKNKDIFFKLLLMLN